MKYLLKVHNKKLIWKKWHVIDMLLVGNKVNGRIWKLAFQENKARQIFRKMNISYVPVRIRG